MQKDLQCQPLWMSPRTEVASKEGRCSRISAIRSGCDDAEKDKAGASSQTSKQ